MLLHSDDHEGLNHGVLDEAASEDLERRSGKCKSNMSSRACGVGVHRRP